jgi:hypothetical protein
MILVFWLSRLTSILRSRGLSAMHPAVGAKPGRATWTKTALPRPAIRGRVL